MGSRCTLPPHLPLLQTLTPPLHPLRVQVPPAPALLQTLLQTLTKPLHPLKQPTPASPP